MVMTRLCPILCLVSIFVVSLHGCSREPSTPESSGSKQFAVEGFESQFIQRLSKATWTIDSSFYDLNELCRAQLYTSYSQSTCHIDPSSAAQAVQFADALWLMWTGRTQSARQILQELQNQDSWCAWGQAGLLHLAYHTENHNQLAALISDFTSSKTDCDIQDASLVQHYSILLALETADWKVLDSLLRQLPQQTVLETPDFFRAQSQYYYATGRAADFAELLSAASPGVQESTEYLTQLAKFNALREGVGGWAQAFHALSDKNKTNRSLAIGAALSDLLGGNPEGVGLAAEMLVGIASRHSNDARLLMEMAAMLALHRQPTVSERVYRKIDTVGTSLQEFTAFHVLTAWNAVHRGDLEQARMRIGLALAMAPKHYGANYLKALIAKRESDAEMGLEALRILLAADPYNENVRSMIKGFYELHPSQDWKSLYMNSRQEWKVPQQ